MSYFDELCRAMQLVAQHPHAIFMGQGVGCAGTAMTDTLRAVPAERLLEFPVAEEMQMGVAIGMALAGQLPVCIFPRWNFLLCATSQIVNHLDRMPFNGVHPKVIIRTAIPVSYPFDPGPQHDGDFTDAFRSMLRAVEVVTLDRADEIVPAYRRALDVKHSSLIVERAALYHARPSGVAA